MKAQKVLIVEDDVFHRSAMEKVLQVYGYKIFSCESGEHAVVKIREESFDILIADFQMRGMEWESIKMTRGITQETRVFRIRTMIHFISSRAHVSRLSQQQMP